MKPATAMAALALACVVAPARADPNVCLAKGWTCSGRSFSGATSFYGNESGSRTASGERFNENAMTAAHRSLRFGTWLKVNWRGRSVIVRINDRGPFIKGRVLDLSKGAARALGMQSIGVAHIHAEILQ